MSKRCWVNDNGNIAGKKRKQKSETLTMEKKDTKCVQLYK